MEKPVRSKGNNKILKYLQKPASFSIPSAAFSPGRNRRPENSSKPKQLPNRAFSGPLISVVPAEARTRQKHGGSYDAPEPTSPKVSCIGQIKHKKANRSRKTSSSSKTAQKPERRPSFAISKMFQRKAQPNRPEEHDEQRAKVAPVGAPSLGQLRKFTSGRETLAGFDWRKALDDRQRDAREGSDDDDEQLIIPHSAPIIIGGGKVGAEPRKEVKLWMRRTMAPPMPLHLD